MQCTEVLICTKRRCKWKTLYQYKDFVCNIQSMNPIDFVFMAFMYRLLAPADLTFLSFLFLGFYPGQPGWFLLWELNRNLMLYQEHQSLHCHSPPWRMHMWVFDWINLFILFIFWQTMGFLCCNKLLFLPSHVNILEAEGWQ